MVVVVVVVQNFSRGSSRHALLLLPPTSVLVVVSMAITSTLRPAFTVCFVNQLILLPLLLSLSLPSLPSSQPAPPFSFTPSTILPPPPPLGPPRPLTPHIITITIENIQPSATTFSNRITSSFRPPSHLHHHNHNYHSTPPSPLLPPFSTTSTTTSFYHHHHSYETYCHPYFKLKSPPLLPPSQPPPPPLLPLLPFSAIFIKFNPVHYRHYNCNTYNYHHPHFKTNSSDLLLFESYSARLIHLHTSVSIKSIPFVPYHFLCHYGIAASELPVVRPNHQQRHHPHAPPNSWESYDAGRWD